MKPLLNEKLRAWWSHRQALDGRMADANAAAVLAETGWVRSVGGVSPYLALLARAGTSREAADAAVAKVEIHELPAARGCTYVLAEGDFALALSVGGSMGDGEMKVAAKLGVTEKEVDKLCDAVVSALAKGPLDPDAIRDSTGKASRSLGEEGKKKGLTTTLPLALGRLQARGDIRRVPQNGRLDQQRYKYTLWKPNPLAKYKMTAEEVQTELARRFFTWAGPATAAEFQAFAGLGVKAAKAAMEPLKLVGFDDERMMTAAQREEFEAFRVPKAAQYVLVGSIDGIALFRRGLTSIVDEADASHKLLKGIGSAWLDLPSHAIFDRGRLVGLWEYDPETQTIAWTSFVPKNKDLTAAVARTEAYVRDQLGDARSFSLDSPKSRVGRIEELRRLATA